MALVLSAGPIIAIALVVDVAVALVVDVAGAVNGVAGFGFAVVGTMAPATLLPMIGPSVGACRFTRQERPLPAVVTTVALVFTTTVGWALVADPALVNPGRMIPG